MVREKRHYNIITHVAVGAANFRYKFVPRPFVRGLDRMAILLFVLELGL